MEDTPIENSVSFAWIAVMECSAASALVCRVAQSIPLGVRAPGPVLSYSQPFQSLVHSTSAVALLRSTHALLQH